MRRLLYALAGLLLAATSSAAVFLAVPDSTPPAGANDHFNTQDASGSKHASWHLRDCTSIDSVIGGSSTCGVDSWWDFDATEDAAKLTIPIGSSLSVATAQQLIGGFAALNPGNANIISYQVEFKFGTMWSDVSNNAHYTGGYVDFAQHKHTRLDYTTLAQEDRVLEHQFAYGAADTDQTSGDPVAVIRLRAYAVDVDEANLDGINPIRLLVSADRDEQPGGDTGAWQSQSPFSTADHIGGDGGGGKLLPFLVRPDKWVRMTTTWDWTGGDGAALVTITASDEDNDPVTIFESVATPGSGIPIQPIDRVVTGSSDMDFNDNGASEDTVFGNAVNWRAQGFTDGFHFDVTGTTSNNGQYVVTGVSTTTTTNDTLHVATGSFVDEQNTSGTATQTGFQKSGANSLRAPELNSSQNSEVTAIEFTYWQRNTLVFKDAAVPHGGRPIP